MANKDNKNKQDFGGFGKGINKAGKPYFYESNKTGGFGIRIIKESEFKKLLKKKAVYNQRNRIKVILI